MAFGTGFFSKPSSAPQHTEPPEYIMIAYFARNTSRKCSRLQLGAALLFAGALALPATAQTVGGINFSERENPADTYEMTHTDRLGQRFASEHLSLKDEVTGAPIIALTTSRHSNSKFYQTHPQWTPDGKHIIFRSSRGRDEEKGIGGFAYAMALDTKEIVQVTTGDWGNNLHLGWKQNNAYFFHNNELKVLDLGQLLQDSAKGSVAEPNSYLTTLATVPTGTRVSGGLGLDANEKRLFFATRTADDSSEIHVADFASGEVTKLIEVPIWANHLQANPYVSGEIMYCWETRGDAPQRMWFLSVDGSGKVEHRPLYVEKPSEWVTHELFTGPDTVHFNVMAHLDRLQENPTGIFSINLRTNEHTNHGQIGKGGFWHCDASEDGRWIVGDTFDGELYRIDAKNGKQTLLTTGHRPTSKGPFTREAHSHHNISPDGKWVLFNSSMLTDSDIMLVPLHPEKRR